MEKDQNKEEMNKSSSLETKSNKSIPELLGIPKELYINNYSYCFKKKLSGDNFSYRCTYRNVCNTLLTISKSELNNINNKKNVKINPKLSNPHKCEGTIFEEANANDVKAEKESIKLASELISLNIDKSLGWHIKNLNDQNIPLKFHKIKKLVYNIKESKYPTDEKFLDNIASINITFNKVKPNLSNIPFCLSKKEFINFTKNKEEKYIIFSTLFQLKLFAKSKMIYIDATFRSSPKKYYQTLNIICYSADTNTNIPVFHIPMSSKNLELYIEIFNDIINVCKRNNINLDFEETIFMCDFEKALREAIVSVFRGAKLKGCYFHYVKCLWTKAKRVGLTNKMILQKTKMIIFILKLLTLIKSEKHIEIINSIKALINKFDSYHNLFNQFISYFEKVWLKTDFIKFDLQYDRIIKSRTNNVCEGFHSYMNRTIEVNRPKLSLFIDKIKQITKFNYDKYIDKMVLQNDEIRDDDNVFKSCYNYLSKYLKQYKKEFDVDDFYNKCNNENDSYLVICNNILKLLFDIDIEDCKEDNSFDENTDENINIEKENFSSNEEDNNEEASISIAINKIKIDDNDDLFEDSDDVIPKKRKSNYNDKNIFKNLYKVINN